MLKNKLSNNRIRSACILGAGALLRFLYVCFSTIYDRQYDIGMIDLDAGHTITGGHLAYIQYLYENFRLPDIDPTSVYQFHHPPFHHYVCALWMRFVSLFVHNTDIIEESMQVIPFVCSLVILVCAAEIFKLLKITGKAYNCVLMIVAFHPALVLLSGSVNNDCMALMFTVLTVYTAMRWMQDKSLKHLCLTGLMLGLGICTKQNVAELAFPLAIIMLIVLIDSIRDKNKRVGKFIGQYALFGLISIPIGMWFYVRNLVKYNVSMLWVYELPKDSWQYTGDMPVINRFLWPVPAEMIDNIKHFKIGCGYNVWMQLIRTSVLGEWDMASVGKGIKVVAVLLMLVGAGLAVVAFAGFVRGFLTDRSSITLAEGRLYRIFFVMSYVVVMIFYFEFVYKYPQECSMSFRYIEITLFLQTAGLGLALNRTESKVMLRLINIAVVAFACLSVIMCGVWMFG